jgi:predicted kinase
VRDTDVTRPRPTPVLIVLIGPPGSGKSTLAAAIAPELGAAVLNSDDITEPFFGIDRDSDAYVHARPTLYAALYRVAETNLALGLSVIVDAPHGAVLKDREWLGNIEAMARRSGTHVALIRCTAPPAKLHQRMQERGEPRDAAKLAAWDAFQAAQPDWTSAGFPHLTVDTSTEFRTVVREALDYVRRTANLPS